MNTLTFTAPQATLLVTLVFLAGVGAATICHAIVRATLTVPFVGPEAEVIVVEAPRRRPPALPARQRFTPPPVLPALSPAQWSRRSFDDPRAVRLAVQIGAGA